MRRPGNLSRRQLMQGIGAVAASAALPRAGDAQTPPAPIGPYSADVLPAGIRSRFVENINGLRMHVLEAGFSPKGRPAVLLLHGFPELAYSWRKVMGPIAAAGYHVFAPDVRGYGRTSGTDVRYDDDLAPFRSLNQVRDMLGLVSAMGYRSVSAVIGHDQGSPLAAWCALVRPDVFRSVTMMSAPFAGPPALPFDTADAPAGTTSPAGAAPADRIYDELAALTPPRKHYQRYYTTREANENMWHASQGLHAFLRAYYHMKSADWPQNHPAPLAARTAGEWAKLPRYYVMDLDKGMAETVAPEMPSAAAIAANKWLPDSELRVYSDRVRANGFPGRTRRVPNRSERPFHLGAAALCRPHDRRAVDVRRRQERLGRVSESRRARADADGGVYEDDRHAPGRGRRALGTAGAAGGGQPVARRISQQEQPWLKQRRSVPIRA